MLNVLADAASQFLFYRGHWDECVWINTWGYEAALALNDLPNAGSRAHGVFGIHSQRAGINDAILWRDRFTQIWASSDDKYKQVYVKRLHGLIAKNRPNYREAELNLQETLATYRDWGSDSGVASVLNDLGNLCCNRSDYGTAEKYYLDALELVRRIGDKQQQAVFGTSLGFLFLYRKQWVEARQWFEQALTLAREVGRVDLIAFAQSGLARAWEAEGQPDLALPLAQEALAIRERLQDKDLVATRELVQRLTAAVQKGAN